MAENLDPRLRRYEQINTTRRIAVVCAEEIKRSFRAPDASGNPNITIFSYYCFILFHSDLDTAVQAIFKIWVHPELAPPISEGYMHISVCMVRFIW